MHPSFRPSRARALALAGGLLAACAETGPAGAPDGASGTGRADAAPPRLDAASRSPDALPPPPDATPAPDAAPPPPLPDVAPPPPPPADAAPPEPDAAPPAPAPHCGAWGPPPTEGPGLALSDAGLRLRCAAGAFDVFFTATPAGVAYQRLEPAAAPRLDSFAVVSRPADARDRWTADANTLRACLEGGTLTVDRATCAFTLVSPAGVPLLAATPSADTRTEAPGTGPDDGTSVAVARAAFEVPPDAAVFGFGQHTGPLDRRGTRFVHWNTDAYDPAHGGWSPTVDPLYASLPFGTLLGDAGSLGVFVDEPRRTAFDLGATAPGRWVVESHGTPEMWLFPGRGLAEPAQAFRDLIGPPALPPRWAFGFHQSRWGYDTANDVLAIAQRFRDLDLPVDALWLDIQHMDGFRTFTFDPARFPEPGALIAALRALGVRTVAIADPGLKVDPAWPVYQRALALDVFLRTPAGEPFMGAAWPGPASFPDFTAPAARDFWAEHIRGLRELGLAGIWLDVNEPTTFPEGGAGLTVPNDTPTASGHTMAVVHNVYGQLESEATFAGLGGAAGRPFIVSRAGYAGIQRTAGLWTGDTPSTWDGLRQTLPMLLSMGLAGVPYVGSDVGGYSGGATPELYTRWLQLGVLSPFFRAHVTSGVPGQEPWQFGIEAMDIARFWLRERMRLLPYFESLALEARETGAPPLRPLVWAFPAWPEARRTEDAAMLGPFVLAAPVLSPEVSVRAVPLPPGRWVEFFGGAVIAGGAAHPQTVTRAALPLYLRAGAVLPRAATHARATDALPDALQIDVVPSDGPETDTSFRVTRNHDGPPDANPDDGAVLLAQTTRDARLTVTVERRGDAEAVPITLVVRLADAGPSRVALDETDLAPPAYTLDLNDRTLSVPMPPGPRRTLMVDLDAPLPDDGAGVDVTFEVEVPPGTPVEPPVHIAGDFNGWQHVPLPWNEPGVRARGVVRVPRSQWYQFKFTRGGWETVEKWPACEEATNRYALGAAHPVRTERVFAWRDACP
jgi:alpha-glucosidase